MYCTVCGRFEYNFQSFLFKERSCSRAPTAPLNSIPGVGFMDKGLNFTHQHWDETVTSAQGVL